MTKLATDPGLRKILWAVDAFETPDETFHQTVQFLRTLSASVRSSITPVYLLSPEQLRRSQEFALPFVEKYVGAAKKALKQRLAMAELDNLLDAQVLVHQRPSLAASVGILSKYAKNHPFDFIVLGSHGRKGLNRALFGSFAEQLLLESKVPVIVVGSASSHLDRKVETILFPTDFGGGAQETFNQTLDLAHSLGAKITVLHTMPNSLEPMANSRLALLASWKEKAKERGLTIEFKLDQSTASVFDSVIHHAEEGKANLIAMTAQSGAVGAALLGSVTRQVVRSAPCPVWVLHR